MRLQRLLFLSIALDNFYVPAPWCASVVVQTPVTRAASNLLGSEVIGVAPVGSGRTLRPGPTACDAVSSACSSLLQVVSRLAPQPQDGLREEAKVPRSRSRSSSRTRSCDDNWTTLATSFVLPEKKVRSEEETKKKRRRE